jgi:putative ABC transport system ATP-binding protein
MLSATGLHHSFGSGATRTDVLCNVSLDIRPGELTLIAGPSGCGKSTLLAILSGLLRPHRGTVRALGQDLGDLSTAELERFRLLHTGFVFQSFSLFPSLTALQQVCLPLAYLDFDRASAERRALDALSAVGLAHRTHARPSALSGGEQQRVAIARAIAKAPQLLFADEPTSALDSASGRAVTELLRQLTHERGTIALCVSHDPRLIAQADRVLQMQDGVIGSASVAA